MRLFSLVTTCHDRFAALLAALPSWLAQSVDIELVIVLSGPDEARQLPLPSGAARFLTVVRAGNAPHFRPSFFRNVGARHAAGEQLGFVDCDVQLHEDWAAFCARQLEKRAEIVINDAILQRHNVGGTSGTVAVSRWLFEKIRGYSENLDDNWGVEDTDLLVRAQRAGGRVVSYDADWVTHSPHADDTRCLHFRGKLLPRSPQVFLHQLRICDEDKEEHPFEANRVIRTVFPPVSLAVTRYERS